MSCAKNGAGRWRVRELTSPTCSVAGCERARVKRDWCGMHYQRWWKYGDPARERETYHVCTAEGCRAEPRSATIPYCERHYYRLRRNGTLNLRGPALERVSSHGYIVVYVPGHPLAERRGDVREYEHRVVFYDANGEGPFRCHWCREKVTWRDMHVDHVNSDKQDNRIENLVASCPPCNQERGHAKVRRTMRERYATWIQFDGENLTLGEWAERIGISRQSLRQRLHNGWPLDRALTEPRGRFGPRPHKGGRISVGEAPSTVRAVSRTPSRVLGGGGV